MRHAKSNWSDPALDDHDRPLNKRGRKSAPVMAKWLKEQDLLPDRILCSSSRRTQETVERMREEVPSLPEAEISEALYHASPDVILEQLQKLPGDCTRALVLGHEPTMSSALLLLDSSATAPGLYRAYEHYPTAAIAVLEADVADWRELTAGRAKFTSFAVPRELMD